VKNSIKDSERAVLGKVRPETERLCVSLPGIPQGVSEHDWLEGYEDPDTGEHVDGYWDKSQELRDYATANPEIWAMVKECMGVMRNKGSHACGSLITPEPVHHYFPLTWVGTKDSGQMCVGFDPKSLEEAGGVKVDILGVQTLETIRIANKLIKDRGGEPIMWNEYPHDLNVYRDIFWTGNTGGVFQFNTALVKPYLKKVKPRTTSDLSAITALCRPGTLDAPCVLADGRSNAQYYVDVATGKEPPFYVHRDLEPILKETNAVMLYQEQFLQIFRDLGGYTFETAEVVRRAIGKKDKETIQLHLGKLKDALLARGWTTAQCDALAEQMLASSRYSFNKAHSQSYAIVGYNTAYLKHNFPLEFWTAELTVFGGVTEKLKAYMQEIGHLVLQPSISRSAAQEWLIEGSKIRAPLSVINGLGPAAAKAIVDAAPYTSVADFAQRCNARAVNRGVFLKLVYAGLFDDFQVPYEKMVMEYWTTKGIKDEIPAEVFSDDKMERFLRRISVNMLTMESLSHVMRDVLLAKRWIECPGRANTPFVRNGMPLLANVQSAAKALERNFTEPVAMVAIFKSADLGTTKAGKKFLKVKLTDGIMDFEVVDWNSMVTPRFPANSVVLVTGVLKPGYKAPVSMFISSIDRL
jgi:DNA polymerase III alpha subunit